MKLATVSIGTTSTAAVLSDHGWHPIADAADLSALFDSPTWRERAGAAASSTPPIPAIEATILNPLPSPRKILCCGLNYRDHIVETGREIPTHPTIFAKFADTLTGPTDTIVVSKSQRVDWEAELVVVVGHDVADADRETAAAAILGYTVANDVSMRDWQSRTLQWLQGKAFDATTPIGPVVVTADELDPTAGLRVVGRVNGEVVQDGNTSELVFDAAALVASVSQFTRLRAGDLVLTGTPGGVGMGMTPPRFLADGDVLETEIEGIGTLTNTVRLRA